MILKWMTGKLLHIVGNLTIKRERYMVKPPANRRRENPFSQYPITAQKLGRQPFWLPIAGESHYQNVLRKASDESNPNWPSEQAYIDVILELEQDNPVNQYAIRVMNDRLETIGYLSSATAMQYQLAVRCWEGFGLRVSCRAWVFDVVEGGHTTVRLDLDTPEDALAKFMIERERLDQCGFDG